jgi:hypothetical protein
VLSTPQLLPRERPPPLHTHPYCPCRAAQVGRTATAASAAQRGGGWQREPRQGATPMIRGPWWVAKERGLTKVQMVEGGAPVHRPPPVFGQAAASFGPHHRHRELL